MFNSRLLCLFALAAMTSVAASPLSAYTIQGNALGAAVGNAITKALGIISEDDSASNSYDQVPIGAVSSSDGNSPIVVVVPDEYSELRAGTLKGTVESLDKFGFRATFSKSSVIHDFTVTYDSKVVDEQWITQQGTASLKFFDESQFQDGSEWSIDTEKGPVIGARVIKIPLTNGRCGRGRRFRFECPVITGPLQTAISKGYPIDGDGTWGTV